MIRLRGLLFLGLVLTAGPAQTESPDLQAKQTLIRAFKEWDDRWTGPLWNFHAPMVVLEGDQVVISTSDTEEACTGPLNGGSWRLYWKKNGIWRSSAPEVRQCQREPSPIARIGPGRFVLFSNPESKDGANHPELRIYRVDPVKGPIFERTLPLPIPVDAKITAYTYRGLATDPTSGAFLLSILNESYSTAPILWFYGTLKDGFLRSGNLTFPDRGCYPYLALNHGKAAVLAVQDIVEPNEDWKKRKFAATGRSWDYVFRRLYLATCEDIRTREFSTTRILDDVSKYGGTLLPMDLIQELDGTLRVLYTRQFTATSMRQLIFPSAPDKTTLEYRELARDGSIKLQLTIPDPGQNQEFIWGRLLSLPHNSVGVIMTALEKTSNSRRSQFWYLPVSPQIGEMKAITGSPALEHFFVACTRGGNTTTNQFELIGSGIYPTLLYSVPIGLP